MYYEATKLVAMIADVERIEREIAAIISVPLPINEQLKIEKIDVDRIKLNLSDLEHNLRNVEKITEMKEKYEEIKDKIFRIADAIVKKKYHLELKEGYISKPESTVLAGGDPREYIEKVNKYKHDTDHVIAKIFNKIYMIEDFKKNDGLLKTSAELADQLEGVVLFTYHILNTAIEQCIGDTSPDTPGNIKYCQIKMVKYIEYDVLIKFKDILLLTLSSIKVNSDEYMRKLIGPIKKTIKFLLRLEEITADIDPKPIYVAIDIKKNSCIPLIITQALMFYLDK